MVVDVVESRGAGNSNECGSSLSIVDGLKRYTQVFAEQRAQEEAEEGEESGALAVSVDDLASEGHVSGVEKKEEETERGNDGHIGDEL